MSILKKGTDFGPTEQVTSTKLDNLVDNASFTDTSGNSVPYTGSTGTCLNGGGLEVTSAGQLQIQDAGVGTSELASTSVTTVKIASSAVTTAKIADANVTNAKLATDAVSTAKITDDAVTQAKIADDAVGANQLASNAVVTASIVDASVTTAKIADDAVTPAKTSFLGTVDTTANSTTRIISKQSDGEYDSVTPSGDVTMTQAGAITIAGSAVTTSKIADANVTTAKIADANVTTAKIANSNVTTAKIANDAVTNAKIASTAVGTTELANSAVTTAKIANDAITSAKIADNAINSANMITGAVINTSNIVDDAVTEDKLSASALTFIKSALYPVGYILSTVTNYANSAAVVAAFGGTTWVRFGAGRVPVGYNSGDTDFNTAEETGGAKTHTLTIGEMPAHDHVANRNNFDTANILLTKRSDGGGSPNGSDSTVGEVSVSGDYGLPEVEGGGGAHNNLQPYIVVYMWKRTV
jgi:microcystin-dependent protein